LYQQLFFKFDVISQNKNYSIIGVRISKLM